MVPLRGPERHVDVPDVTSADNIRPVRGLDRIHPSRTSIQLLVTRSRVLALLLLVAGSLAAIPGLASAAAPRAGVCIDTGILPAIGTCPSSPGESAAPEADPVPAEKPKKKAKKKTKAKPTACRDRNMRPTKKNSARIRHATLCLLNRERRKRGRKALKTHRSLTSTARRYGGIMVTEGFFAHVSPSGSTLRARVGRSSYLKSRSVRRWSLGENLAWGAGARATPSEIVRSWMRSPGHRRNILDRKFRDIGIGVATGVPQPAGRTARGATYVTVFGLRARR